MNGLKPLEGAIDVVLDDNKVEGKLVRCAGDEVPEASRASLAGSPKKFDGPSSLQLKESSSG